jgi:hypothetical protein
VNFVENFSAPRHYSIVSHISEHNLERYYLGQITDEAELAPLEKHLLLCQECLDSVIEAEWLVDNIRVALLRHADAKGRPAAMPPLDGVAIDRPLSAIVKGLRGARKRRRALPEA